MKRNERYDTCFKCQVISFIPPLFDRDVNHDGRKLDIRGAFGEGRTIVLGREAGEKGENVS